MDAETQVWRGSVFDPTRHLLLDCKVNAPQNLANPSFFHSISLARMLVFLQGHRTPKTFLVQWVIWCGDLAVKNRVHATAD